MFFKKENGAKIIAPIVFIITCLRVYSYIPIEKLFFDVYERTITDAPRFWATICLCILFSAFTALFTGKAMKENSNLSPLLLIFVTDPVFYSAQDNISVLLLSSIFTLCLYVFLHTTNLLVDSIIFCGFSFISALLIPETVYGTIPVAFAVILIKYFGTFCTQKIKSLFFAVLSAAAIISAYLLNDTYKRELFLTNKFLNGKTEYFYNPSFILLVFSVIIFAGCGLLLYKTAVFAKTKIKSKNYEYINEDCLSVIYLSVILVFICLILQIFARFNDLVIPSYSAMNISAPTLIIFLTIRYKNSFDNILKSLSSFWRDHFGVCFVSFLLLAMLYFKLSKDCFSATNILTYATLYLT